MNGWIIFLLILVALYGLSIPTIIIIASIKKDRRDKILQEEQRKHDLQEKARIERINNAITTANLDNMSGRDFELYIGLLLQSCGYSNVNVTKSSGDYGADILADNSNHESCCFQCKRVIGTVGVKAVQEVYSAKQYYNCQRAFVITNRYFSKPAKEMAQKCNVTLIDRDILAELIS